MGTPDEPGNCPIIATPFDEDGAVDDGNLERELRFPADAERDRLAEIVTDVGHEAGLSPVLSVTNESTRATASAPWNSTPTCRGR